MMNALETVRPLENRSDDGPPRRSIRIARGPAAYPAVEQPSFASDTMRDQDSVIPKEYLVVVPGALRERSLDNSAGGVAAQHQNEMVGHRTARSSQLGRRSAPAVAERFWLLNRWQGQVLTVGPETFTARLFDPANPSILEHAEFAISELPPDGLALLRPGAVFYWMIGYRDLGSRQRMRESVIWMRRSGRMSKDKFGETLDHIEKIWGAIDEGTKSATGAG